MDDVETFAREKVAPAAAAIDQSAMFPRELVAEASRVGLLGVTVPPAYGGAGQDTVTYALAIERVARASATLAVILVVQNSLVVDPILREGHRGPEGHLAARDRLGPGARLFRTVRGAGRVGCLRSEDQR